MMGVTYCFRKEDHVVIVMPYMEHQAIVVCTLSHISFFEAFGYCFLLIFAHNSLSIFLDVLFLCFLKCKLKRLNQS